MKRVTLVSVGLVKDEAARSALKEIEGASAEFNLLDIANAFTINAAYTPTRSLNVSAPTLANAVAFLATFIDDCKRGGSNRST